MTADPLLFADTVLSFRNVTVRYGSADSAVAVNDLTLTVEAGQRVALIGPSGAGKSTILSLAAGLTLPTGGVVEVMGVDSIVLGRHAHRPTRREIGIISQDFSLIGPLRVASNVAAGRLGSSSWLKSLKTLVRPGPVDEIAKALDSVGIVDKLWERTDRLSGGQQQRTAVARALFQNPQLLLGDEPVSALDPARSESVMAVLTGATNGDADSAKPRTLIVSMHDAPLALRHCDRIVALREGCVEFDLAASEVSEQMLTDLYLLDESAIG
ncbi:MAG: ATP-binding cassette domain-containing protein [Acidimicrobiales bacterium]|mgnify:CR=1 FL=1